MKKMDEFFSSQNTHPPQFMYPVISTIFPPKKTLLLLCLFFSGGCSLQITELLYTTPNVVTKKKSPKTMIFFALA